MRRARIRLLLMATFGGLLAPATTLAAVTPTGSLTAARTQAPAVALPGGTTTSSVLVTGGYDNVGAPLSSAERYDVATGVWAPIAAMSRSRAEHDAFLLPSGGVLLVGGRSQLRGGPVLAGDVDLYDPLTDSWDPGAAMLTARSETTASVITERDGSLRVLVVGGRTATPGPSAAVERYNPALDQWETTPSLPGGERYRHAAATLPDGRVLVAGGLNANGGVLSTTEIYDPILRTWSAGPPMPVPRADFSLSVVDATHLLAAGGTSVSGGTPVASSSVIDPTGLSATSTWTDAGSMAVARAQQKATVVRSGWVAVTGGRSAASPGGVDSGESWTPANGWGGLYNLPGGSSIGGVLNGHSAAAIPQTDEVLVAGGGVIGGAGPGTVTDIAARWTPDRPALIPPTTPGPVPPTTPQPGPAPTPLAEPIQSRSLIAATISGDVYVRIGQTDEYRELLPGEAVPVGTVIDASDGRVQLVAAVGAGKQSAWFWGGTFTVLQPRLAGGYVEIRLFGKPVCKTTKKSTSPSTKKAARTAAQKTVKRKKKPKVWGDGKGKFRTKGVNSTASVRGTRWLVEERCSGTFTKVDRGRVSVRDFPRHKTVIVKAGKNYLARPRR